MKQKISYKQRLSALFLLVISVIFLNQVVDNYVIETNVQQVSQTTDVKWAQKRFLDRSASFKIPDKKKKRVLYLSNSHALTGGEISNHMQFFLDKLFPDEYELLDLSSGGMFAPEFLQKFAAAVTYNIDIAIIALSYIAFSDRMGLSNQAASAHSFFHPDVFTNLNWKFWFLNYDLNLYLNKLGERLFPLYAYRNEVRNYWEQPLVKKMHSLQNRSVLSLEVEETTRWRFPRGFVNNLFQWPLYALGREAHMNNIGILVELANDKNIPLITANLPIHWEKEPGEPDVADISEYRQKLATTLRQNSIYVDYQDRFPKAFSTYDALHPTWHGARLHALDFVLRLNKLRVNPLDEKTIHAMFSDTDQVLSEQYLLQLNGDYPPTYDQKFRRYDISEPENARYLLRKIAATRPGSMQERQYLESLAIRFYFWQRTNFYLPEKSLWENAVNIEVTRFLERLTFFINELGVLQNQRFGEKQVPELDTKEILATAPISFGTNIQGTVKVYQLADGYLAEQYFLQPDNKAFAILIKKVDAQQPTIAYIDIFGNGSFAQINIDGKITLPPWALLDEPWVGFGI